MFPGSVSPGPSGSWQAGTGTPRGITVEVDGSVYLAGLRGPDAYGLCDAYVSKYSTEGEPGWFRQFGAPIATRDGAEGVALGKDGDVYVAGWTGGALPGQVNAGDGDIYLKRYRPTGVEVWTREFGSDNFDGAYGVAIDSEGNISIAGQAEGALPGQTSSGSLDAFVSRYNTEGHQLWTRQFGTGGFDRSDALAVDGKGNVYVVGGTEGDLGGQGNRGSVDAFLRKYSPAGVELWTRQFGTTEWDIALAVAVDQEGNACVAGNTDGAFPGYVDLGEGDVFLRKYGPNGEEMWTRQWGSDASDLARGAAVDVAGNCLVVGLSLGALPGQKHLGGWDAFLWKYGLQGEVLATSQFGTKHNDEANAVTVDRKGNIWVVVQQLAIVT
ncbi:MAG: hypothetical protein EXR55_05180 [Dehalococcoidia bacterium]|nr:hypothetical protein [Dehalococcoidia bacterium]